jgi:arylsulfatase A-like enzyme
VDLAPGLSRASGPVPNIFIFTIDSLRRDYLEPYNPAVGFTPSIAAFAKESTVFEKAFTRYGGTGLSEPAIWTGAMLLHKQYIMPFSPMNALEKLLAADQYQLYLSRDPILRSILQPSTPVTDLEGPTSALTVEFTRSLQALQQQIEQRPAVSAPMFAYIQPQNLHISVIQREGASAPAGETFPGFYTPYAWRVKAVDAAFGGFIRFLKARGLYEHSIIVLTSDHGDSLGEEGRWGHAYTLYPEIVRIPLVMHLPEDLRTKVSADAAGLAFSTDITPSLYYLLGRRPVQKNELFGMPLFTETAGERARDPHATYLLASSYAAVYGILADGGRQLYVADGVNYRDYRFELNGMAAQSRPVNARFQREQDELIRGWIEAVNRFYHFDAAGGGRP